MSVRQRDRVRAMLAEAGPPLDAQSVADALAIHVSTARFHLGNLVTEGAAETVALPPVGVGRPRVGYRIVHTPSIDDLTVLLIARMGSTPELREHLGAEAGREWAARHAVSPAAPGDLPAGTSAKVPNPVAIPDPVVVVETILTRLGFRISGVVSAFGRHRIELCGCPLQSIAVELPEVARGVVRGIVEQALMANRLTLGDSYQVSVLPDCREGACELALSLTRIPATA